MRRYGNIITEDTVTLSLCYEAILSAAQHKRHRKDVQNVLSHIKDRGYELQKMILEMTWYPKPYQVETIIERGKEREITKPVFWPDQCVHHLMILVAGPIFAARIHPFAIGSIPGRGAAMGIRLLRKWLRRTKHKNKVKYCIKCDIRHCYPSLKREVVLYHLERYFFKDPKYLELWRRVLSSCEYLALGNFTSTFLLNLIFSRVDGLLSDRKTVTYFVRYIDDFVIFGKNKRKLRRLFKEEFIPMLDEEFGLEIKPDWVLFEPKPYGPGVRSIDFLGFKFYGDGKMGLRKRNWKKIRRDSLRLKRSNGVYSFKRCASIISRKGMLEQIFCRKYIEDYELQAIVWKLKKEIRRKLSKVEPFCLCGFMVSNQIRAMFEGVLNYKVKDHLDRYKRFVLGKKRYIPGPIDREKEAKKKQRELEHRIVRRKTKKKKFIRGKRIKRTR